MKRIIAIAAIGWLLLAGSIWASQVTNVALSYQDGSTVARIDIQGPVRFTHQTEVPKDGRPDRVIVDVLSATHALGAKEFLNLPVCVVTGIRSSQYAVSPEKIVRIVFDLSTTPVYQVDSDDQSITLRFNHQEAQSFAAWSSSPAKPELVQEKPVELAVAPVRVAPVAPTPATVTAQNVKIEEDRQASLAENKVVTPKAESAPAKKAEPQAWTLPTSDNNSGLVFNEGWESPESWKPKSPSVFPSANRPPTPLTVAQTQSAVQAPVAPELAKIEPVSLPKAQPVEEMKPLPLIEPAKVVNAPELPKKEFAVQQAAEIKPLPLVEPTEVTTAVEQPKEVLAVQPLEAKTESKPVQVEPSFAPITEEFTYPPLQVPSSLRASAPNVTPATPVVEVPLPQATETATLTTGETKPAVPQTELAQAPEATTEASVIEKAAELGIEKSNILDEADFAPAVELPSTVKPEDMNMIAAVDGAAPMVVEKTPQRATARFRREAQSDKIRGTMVAAFPERLVIQYSTENERDPFDPLIDDSKSFNNPVENRIPNVEGLKLVGILESDAGSNRALFEDKGGFSYILQSGDKVRNGYVLRVEPDQVYFQIFEYGWSRTVALTMEY
jgi:hypothetical protein